MGAEKEALIISDRNRKAQNIYSITGTWLFIMLKKMEKRVWGLQKVQLSRSNIKIRIDKAANFKIIESGFMLKINKRELQQYRKPSKQ